MKTITILQKHINKKNSDERKAKAHVLREFYRDFDMIFPDSIKKIDNNHKNPEANYPD